MNDDTPNIFTVTEQQLLSHFAEVRQNGKCIRNEKHLFLI